MSMAQGFAQGFGMMNNFMQQQDTKERQAALDAENNRRYNESIDWRNKQWDHQLGREQKQDAITDENRMLDYAAKGITADMTPEQKQAVMMNQRAIALQQAEEDRQWGRQKDRLSMSLDSARIRTERIKQDSALAELTNANHQRGLQAALIGDDETAKKYLPPTLLSAWAKRADDANTYAMQYAELDKAYQSAKTEQDKKTIIEAMNQHITADTPEARALFNSANYQSYVERLKANPDIEEISHAGFVPANGGYIPLMSIKYKGKKDAEVAPATKMRTGDKDDTVVVLPPSVIKQRAVEGLTIMGSAKRAMQENPDLQRAAYGMKPGDEIKNLGYGGNSVNVLTGEPVVGAAGANDKNALKQERLDFDKLRSVQKALADQYAATLDPNEKAKLGAQWSEITAMIAQSVTSTDKVTTSAGQGLPMQPTTSGANTAPSSKFDFAGRLPSPASIPDKK